MRKKCSDLNPNAQTVVQTVAQLVEQLTVDTEMNYHYKDLLNRLADMQTAPYYATACHTLVQAEMAIVNLEAANKELTEKLVALEAQEPAAWAGSGSIAAAKHGFEGYLWGSPEKAHPIALYLAAGANSDAEDAAKWRAYQKRKTEVIAAGMGRNTLRTIGKELK